MRAVVLEAKGGPEVLTVREAPDPSPGPEEVLVDVVGTALNRADLLQRRGQYPGPKAALEIPGLEFAGRVAAVGERVEAWTLGDEVMGIVGGGGYAERLAVHERQVMRVPASVGVGDAAAIPEVWITAWDALVPQGGLGSGGAALVHAGASGVGTAAIQIVKAIGARSAVTCSAGKRERVAALGADVVIDYASEDFVAAAKELTGGRGVNVILDVIGGGYLDRNLDALALKGAIVQVGTMGEATATLALGKLLMKRARLIGTVLRARPLEEKIAVTQAFAAAVLPLFDRGLARPVIDSRFPLDRIADAHAYMESNANVGKILIDVAS
ncbi:MAG: NAD(P)H-quinone oxidoreductase [Acidimicrobiales bacterium]